MASELVEPSNGIAQPLRPGPHPLRVPAPAQAEPIPVARSAAAQRLSLLWKAAIYGSFGAAAPLLLFGAHHALDRVSPDKAAALAWLGATFVIGMAALAVIAIFVVQARDFWGFGLGAAVGVAFAFLLVALATLYGPPPGSHPFFDIGHDLSGVEIALGFVPPLLVVLGLALVAAWLHDSGRPRGAAGIAIAIVTAPVVAAISAAGYLLATLPHQVEAARRANQAPSTAVAALVVVLLVGAAVHRRRRA